MGRPRRNNSFTWGFSIDEETKRMVEELADKLGLKKSAVVRMAVRKLYEVEMRA
ncbi:ribbon-helix-helix protein, CopG family [Pyrococcus kukulkanii]|uniref:ribbon-helix-helix protein, CopG family n=1 Tax=Pyrococcus kukulkanii TaxID=1609559 RepID=UPI0035628D73